MSTKRLCTYGGCQTTVIVDENETTPPRCPRHAHTFTPKKRYHSHQFHKARYFYNTTEWRKLRDWKIRKNPLCEHCDSHGRITPATEVDHIVEIEDGGSKTDPDNLQSLCTRCHRKKTGEEKRKREEKKKLNGFSSLSDF